MGGGIVHPYSRSTEPSFNEEGSQSEKKLYVNKIY